MNALVFSPSRLILALAVCSLLGVTGTTLWRAEGGTAQVALEHLASPTIETTGPFAIAWCSEANSDQRAVTKASLRKVSRRTSSVRPVARVIQTASLGSGTVCHHWRTSLVANVPSAIAADLPRLCRWLI